MLDPVTARVLRLLQRDVRRPYAEVAEELGLTAADVEVRVQGLVDEGLVCFTAVTDPLRLGFVREAMIGVTVEPGRHDDVVAALVALPEVHYVVSASGGFDVLCELAGTSDAHLLELLSHQVRPIPGIAGLRTFLYLRTEKMTFDWDVR